MKICDNCGAYNSNERKLCVDCGEVLGDKISEAEEEQIRRNTGTKIEKMYNKKDPLYVSVFDKLMGAISLLGVLLCIVFTVINYVNHKNSESLLWGILFFLLASAEAFIPKLSWWFEKLRLGLYVDNADDMEPGLFYFYSRKITIIAFAGYAVVLFVLNFL